MNKQLDNAGSSAMEYLYFNGINMLGFYRKCLRDKIISDLDEASNCTLLQTVISDWDELKSDLNDNRFRDLQRAIDEAAMELLPEKNVWFSGDSRLSTESIAAVLLIDAENKRNHQIDLDNDRTALEEERDCILREAQDIAKSRLYRANLKAEQILSEAERESANIRQQAQNKLDEANDVLNQKRAEAEEKANDLLNSAIERARKEQIKEMLRSIHAEDNEAGRVAEKARAEIAENTANTRMELCTEMSGMQKGINDELKTVQEELNRRFQEMVCQIGNAMNKWRESLYKQPVDALASCYIELCHVIDFGNRKLVETQFKYMHIDDEAVPEFEKPTMNEVYEELEEHMTKLLKRIDRLRKKYAELLPLYQLEVYTPEMHDSFDPAWHTLSVSNEEANEADLYGREIATCVIPGIRKVTDNGERRAFEAYKAEVTIR